MPFLPLRVPAQHFQCSSIFTVTHLYVIEHLSSCLLHSEVLIRAHFLLLTAERTGQQERHPSFEWRVYFSSRHSFSC